MVLNATVVPRAGDPPSFLTIYPTGTTQPNVSNLNYSGSLVVQNLATLPVGASNQVTVYNNAGTVDVVFDEEGYYTNPVSGTDGRYSASAPSRVLDTRGNAGGPIGTCYQSGTGTPLPNCNAPLGPGQSVDVQIDGTSAVPTGAEAATLNLTETNATGPVSFLTLYPAGQMRPNASNINFVGGQTRANRATLQLGAGGRITVYNNEGTTDVILDANGSYTPASASAGAGSLFTPVTPSRFYDTRGGAFGPVGSCNGGTCAPLGPGGSATVQVTGSLSGIPAGATAAAINLTEADHSGPDSFLTAFPDGTGRPNASDVNFSQGDTIPNFDVVMLPSSGQMDVYNNLGSTDVVADAFGYFGPAATQPVPFSVTVSPSSATVAPDGSSTQMFTATVKDNTGTAVPNDPVTFSLGSASPAGACGSVSPTSGTTDASGQASTTYTSSMTGGTCTLTATEGETGASGTASITQQTPPLTLSPSTQSAKVGSTAATITARASNPDGSPQVGVTVLWRDPTGPNSPTHGSCTTNSNGVCTFQVGPGFHRGTDNISACIDTNSNGVCDAGEPTATATATWTTGDVANVILAPGNIGVKDPTTGNGSCPQFGCGSHKAVSGTENQQFTAYATAVDVANDPLPGIDIQFEIYKATSATYFGATHTCDPVGPPVVTSGCTHVTSSPVATDANGTASLSWTETGDGIDYFWAHPAGNTGSESMGAEVVWGKAALTFSQPYTGADNDLAVGQGQTYTGTSVDPQGGPVNTNCVAIEIYNAPTGDDWAGSPKANPNVDGSSAFFSGVPAGQTAYSDKTCTMTITSFSGQPKQIFMKPDAVMGQFSFTMSSNLNGDVAAPVAFTTTTTPVDFTTMECNSSVPGRDKDCDGGDDYGSTMGGPTAIGASTFWGTLTPGFTVSVTPVSAASIMHGLTRKYSDTVLENSQPNTSFPNGFSFMELVNGMSSPGDIAFVEYTLGATTYCVQERGNNGPASMCPSGDTPVADGTTSNGVTVKVHNYPGSSTADNDVLVTGIGTFDVTISDESSTGGSCQGSTAPAGCTGDATPVGWAEVNSNTSLDGGEIFATGGTTTFN